MLEPAHLTQALEELFDEADEKFQYRSGCRGVLLIDLAAYVAGPTLVIDAIRSLPRRWPRVTLVAIYVDEPYSTPPPPSGEVSGAVRMWCIDPLEGTLARADLSFA
jgi:hypothetical protein